MSKFVVGDYVLIKPEYFRENGYDDHVHRFGAVGSIKNVYDSNKTYDVIVKTADPPHYRESYWVPEKSLELASERNFKVGDQVIIKDDFFDRNKELPPRIKDRIGVIKEIGWDISLGHDYCKVEITDENHDITYPTVYVVDKKDLRLMYNDRDFIEQKVNNFTKYLYERTINTMAPVSKYDSCLTSASEFAKKTALEITNMIPNIVYGDHDGDEEMDDECDTCALMKIDKVIFNDPATIIFWDCWHWETEEHEEHGEMVYNKFLVQDKTVVKCAPGEKFNKYHGFCAAVAKRAFETNSNINRIIKNAQDDSKKPVQKNAKKKETKKK